jgi:hypothetical protein
MRIGRPRCETDTVVEHVCKQWGQARRVTLGISPRPLEPAERLGKIRTALSSVDAPGGGMVQSFPEVYTGDVLLVHLIWHAMPRPNRAPFELNYIVPEIPYKLAAKEAGMSISTYCRHLSHAKLYVAGALSRSGLSASGVDNKSNPASAFEKC